MAKQPKVKPQRRRTKANSSPKRRPQDVKDYWDRAFSSDGYLGAIVKVHGRRGRVVTFSMVVAGEVEKRKLTVDLDDGDYVWSDLPSTAQAATRALPYGLLFLTKDYFTAKKVPAPYDPPKIPRGASL